MKDKEVREVIRERYGSIARQGGSCCASDRSCCEPDPGQQSSAQTADQSIGYSQDEIASVPEGSNLGLGCGNPLALASIN